MTRALMISARAGFSKPGTISPAISSVWPPCRACNGEKIVFMNPQKQMTRSGLKCAAAADPHRVDAEALAKANEIGAGAGTEMSIARCHPEGRRRIERGHSQRLLQRQPQSMDKAHGRDHVEIGAGKRSVLQPQAACFALDPAAVEGE